MAHDDHGFAGERMLAVGLARGGREAGQLLVDDLEVFDRVGAAGCVGDVDQMNQQAGALNVAEELGAQAGAEMRAFNEAGHIGDDEGLLVGLLADGDHAEIGFEGGEGIIGDFGLGGGDAGDERGFAGIGIADQADVGQQLEFEPIKAFLAGAAQLVLARGLMGAGGKVLIAAPAATAFGDDQALVGLAESRGSARRFPGRKGLCRQELAG